MNTQSKKWKILGKLSKTKSKVKSEDIINILLRNRGISTKKQKQEFFNPTPPEKLTLKNLKISESNIKKSISRIKKAIANNEKIIIYGDYDADGICATAILWEALYSLKANVLPYIPERFSEGYGLNEESVKKLRNEHKDLILIITVDNGIVATRQVKEINKLGIDVILSDHHQKGKRLPKSYALIHTTEIGGAAVAWILAREVRKALKTSKKEILRGLELVAIGTIADQLPLIGPNRSLVKFGLEQLGKTKRIGLIELFNKVGIEKGQVRPYEVGFIIAPRINAMGRLEHGIDSLRLLCTSDKLKASKLAYLLNKTNLERQRIVEEVVSHAKEAAGRREWHGAIVLAHETYHEGVIGLAASRLVEKYYRPAIVLSKGKKYSKASARSIPGFNIIEMIRKFDALLIAGGGHPMAAGFTIETKKLDEFSKGFQETSSELLTDELLARKLKIDVEVDFNQLNWKFLKTISSFEPIGIGNPTPTFVTKKVKVISARLVGKGNLHLKLRLERDGFVFDAIAFGFGNYFPKLPYETVIDIVYVLEKNIWNGRKSLQLKIKDIRI